MHNTLAPDLQAVHEPLQQSNMPELDAESRISEACRIFRGVETGIIVTRMRTVSALPS